MRSDDDWIPAAPPTREAPGRIADAGGEVAGIVIALDRQEAIDPAKTRRSAAQSVAADHGLPVIAVATLADLLAFASGNAELAAQRERLLAYRAAYGSDEAS